MLRQDTQWWAGAFGSALVAAGAAILGHHPYDIIVGGLAAGLLAFSMYKITPSGSVKQ